MVRFKKFSKNCKNLEVFKGYNIISKVCYNYDNRLYKDVCSKKNCPLLERKLKKGMIEVGVDGKCFFCAILTKDHENNRYVCPRCRSLL